MLVVTINGVVNISVKSFELWTWCECVESGDGDEELAKVVLRFFIFLNN